MISLFAGLRSQITLLKEKLKKHNPSKNPKVYKEILDALEAAEKRYAAEKTKREEKQKAKEQVLQEVEKEAINVPSATEVGAVSQNAPAPADANGAPAATPSTTPNQNQSCPLCGGLTFPDAAAYQQHMQYTHASDIMPTSPGQKEDKLVASVEPGSCPRCGTNKTPGTEFCDECKKQVKEAEPPMVHPVAKPVDEGPKFKLDDEVRPVRGGDSIGKVMRWDGKPSDLVYVMWNSGPLADRDTAGGYYPHDLELVTEEEPIEARGDTNNQPPHNPGPEHICPDCKDWHTKHADLKSKYEDMLKDLKEERDIHYTQGNQKWVDRLDQKIIDLTNSIKDKFGDIETKSCSVCGQKKESGAQNAKELTLMDHTPPRANTSGDEIGRDTYDEMQDEWSEPARDVESAKGAPGTLFNAETAPHVVEQLQSFLNAPYINAQISTLGGDEHVSIMLTISADPEEKWTNNIMQNSRYGNFSIGNDGTVEQFSGGFSKWKQPNNAMRKTHVKSVQQLIDVLNKFMAKVNTPAAPVTPSIPVDPNKTSALKAPIIAPTKLLVFKREFLATPLKEQEKHGGYEISQNGKKLFKINSKDSQPMSKEQIQFCAQIELERGYKKAVLKEDIAFLKAGSKVLILAQDKSGKRLKFANLGEGLRGWAPTSKFRVLASENETMKHLDHVDGVLGHRATEKLVDCPQGSGNIKWIALNELLPATQPPATPESLNDLESKKWECKNCGGPTEANTEFCSDCGTNIGPAMPEKESTKECPDCHGTFEGAEGATCPTCGRFAVQKEALRPALAPQILNRRQEVNASGCDQCDAAMINGVFCHETGCPNAPKKCRHGKMSDSCSVCSDPFEGAEVESSLEKDAIIVEQDGKFCVRSPKNKNWNGGCYPTRAAAEKRLQTVEMFKHMKGSKVRPFSKKADVLTDHITEVKNNIEQVQQRLQEIPAVKTAVVTDETIEETTNDPNATLPSTTLAPALPTIQNVQPTDQDNLEIPVPMPTSPPPPGQKWVYNDVDSAFVLMPDPAAPGKTI